MKRKVDYTWRLAELMAARGLHNTTDLIPLLAERDPVPTAGLPPRQPASGADVASGDRGPVRHL
ncbi:MAG: hypothetical protein QOF15_2731 [Mycobacterium sp.]|nr:hypothetical protein [Mycobacterium sp.]